MSPLTNKQIEIRMFIPKSGNSSYIQQLESKQVVVYFESLLLGD